MHKFLRKLAMATVVEASHAAGPAPGKTTLYASVGPELIRYDVDVEGAALVRRESVTLQTNAQYAWPHMGRGMLYVASSSNLARVPGNDHRLGAYRIDPASGALTPHGDEIRLPTRPINVTTDAAGTHVLVAFNRPSALRVYRVNPDATLGGEVQQAETPDAGVFAHQVRVAPEGQLVFLVTRGNSAGGDRPEEPGALKVFRFHDGVLEKAASVAPNSGYGFGPRHLDFHPARPWVYVSRERENRLDMFRLEDGIPAATPAFSKCTLCAPSRPVSHQAAGPIHVHPGGRFVYVANRADGTVAHQGRKVFAGGENSLAVYAIDAGSGEPVLIQHIDTRGIHCRTFHIDPGGCLLVAAHSMKRLVRGGDAMREVPAGLSVFRIGTDGRLAFARKYDIDIGEKFLFWVGMVPIH